MPEQIRKDSQPTVFHITHYKADSQWVAEILKHAAPDRTVLPKLRMAQFYDEPLRPGSVYLTVYAPKPDFERVTASFQQPRRVVVVIRDLRDTLVSWYFSLCYSHETDSEEMLRLARRVLSKLSVEEGLLLLIGRGAHPADSDAFLSFAPHLLDDAIIRMTPSKFNEYLSMEFCYDAHIQLSWLNAPEALLMRYEEFVLDEQAAFAKLIAHCEIDIAPERLRQIVADNSFAAITGRRPGQEDVMAHQRKGIVGDWRNYFTQSVREAFKERFGDVLTQTGYDYGSDIQHCVLYDAYAVAQQRQAQIDEHAKELAAKEAVIQAQNQQLLDRNDAAQTLREQLEEKERVIQAQQQELVAKEACIQAQHQELLAKEAVIQQFIAARQSFVRYCDITYLRPFLKRLLSASQQARLRRWRRRFQPKLGAFYQHPPRPQRLPESYHEISSGRSTALLPVVSIVTPSFNHARFLERTMQSVLDQQYPRLEYLVQDGASTDDTTQILARYQARLAHLESCQDCGQADAINRGFCRASGEIMAWLNSDDLLLPGAVAYVVNFFLGHPEIDVVYGHRIVIDEDDREIGRWVLPPHDDAMLVWADYVPQETLFWRRRIWEKAGGHVDESYHFALDRELLLRFYDAGAKFARLPPFLAGFRVHGAQKTSRELEGRGWQEMSKLRKQRHERDISNEEALHHLRDYMRKHLIYHAFYRAGLLKY